MTENICLMLTEATSTNALARVLSLAIAAVDLHKRTVLYVGGRWADLARAGEFEQHEREFKTFYKISVVESFRYFQSAGGQIWVSAFNAQPWDLSKRPLVQGASIVDDKTLLTFLTQETVVLNF